MDGLYGRKVFANSFGSFFSQDSGGRGVANDAKKTTSIDESTYVDEPSWFDRFACFLSGTSYSGGSYIDEQGQCQVKGYLVPRNLRGR